LMNPARIGIAERKSSFVNCKFQRLVVK